MFPGEPLLRVTARLTEAQLLESLLLNVVNFQTLIATKAARVVQAAAGGRVYEFGLRRAQGLDGALSAARAAYVGGVDGTSNVAAGERYGIPVSGTMAHSWVQAFGDEQAAFARFAELYPERAILLVDTYDTLDSGIPHAIPVLRELQARGGSGFGVRLDSGDLGRLSRAVRERLDAAGLQAARIVVSSDLDEARIEEAAPGESAHRRVGRRHAPGHRPRRPGPGRGLQAGGGAPRRRLEARGQALGGAGQGHPARHQAGGALLCGRRRHRRPAVPGRGSRGSGPHRRECGRAARGRTPARAARTAHTAACAAAAGGDKGRAAGNLGGDPPARRRQPRQPAATGARTLSDPAPYPVRRSPALEKLLLDT